MEDEKQANQKPKSQNTTGFQDPNSLIFQQQLAPGAVVQQSLVSNPSQKGDIYYGGDGVRFKRIGIGLPGQVLTVVNGIPVWSYLLSSGLAAARPTSGTFTGQQYLATDTGNVSIWQGSSWISALFS